ncbi:MAG: methyltransferase domain-containing protein [Rhizonema sp. PD38]|nr:methyltransferase domain-containing protein [Rhizonema sp. PD38]
MTLDKYKQQLIADFNSRTNYDQGDFKIPAANRLISLAQLHIGQRVLDIATGTGLVALEAAKIVAPEGEVIGVDMSTGMLHQAKQKMLIEGLKNIEFIEADVEYLNFSDRSFDRILCSLAISYLTNIPSALQRWYRFLKPDGIIVFNCLAETAFPPSVLFREVAKRYNVKVPNPNEPLGTYNRCKNLLQECGFKDIEVSSEQFGWYYTPDPSSAEDFWRINSRNVFGYQVFQLTPAKLQQCKAEYIAEIQALPTTEQGVWCDASIFFVVAGK